MTNPLFNPLAQQQNRRFFLRQSSFGLGLAALHAMGKPTIIRGASESPPLASPNAPGVEGFPNLPAKAKRVIFLCMAGGPSHLETFDPKSELARLDGQPMPESFTKGNPLLSFRARHSNASGHRPPLLDMDNPDRRSAPSSLGRQKWPMK